METTIEFVTCTGIPQLLQNGSERLRVWVLGWGLPKLEAPLGVLNKDESTQGDKDFLEAPKGLGV